MKILQICLKPPYPKVDGGCMAMAALTESMLLDGHSVKVLTISTHKHPFISNKIPKDIFERTAMETVEIDTRIKPLNAFLNLFSTQSYNIERFYNSAFEDKLLSILKNRTFDIILLESIFCTPYIKLIRKNSNGKIVLRTHNVEYQIWEQLALQKKNIFTRKYFQLLSKRLKTYETDSIKKVDGIVAITEEDKKAFKQHGIACPTAVIPIGFNVAAIPVQPLSTNKLKLYHLGAMDWQPNIDGINWFLNDIWPQIEREFPEIECHLAGRNMPPHFLKQAKGNLKITGEIESAENFISNKNIAIVPLLSGSGMRVKIVEALAQGKVIITTTLGATGIPFTEGKNLLIANTADQFILKLKLLERKPELIEEIGKNARQLAETAFDIKKLSTKLTYFYKNL